MNEIQMHYFLKKHIQFIPVLFYSIKCYRSVASLWLILKWKILILALTFLEGRCSSSSFSCALCQAIIYLWIHHFYIYLCHLCLPSLHKVQFTHFGFTLFISKLFVLFLKQMLHCISIQCISIPCISINDKVSTSLSKEYITVSTIFTS